MEFESGNIAAADEKESSKISFTISSTSGKKSSQPDAQILSSAQDSMNSNTAKNLQDLCYFPPRPTQPPKASGND